KTPRGRSVAVQEKRSVTGSWRCCRIACSRQENRRHHHQQEDGAGTCEGADTFSRCCHPDRHYESILCHRPVANSEQARRMAATWLTAASVAHDQPWKRVRSSIKSAR